MTSRYIKYNIFCAYKNFKILINILKRKCFLKINYHEINSKIHF
ncbi:hypothetical protein M8044_000287 [Columbia Basin potato purple top phytoplasma]|uniref:Uncharacterized protein n=1 Tax=Columbia Basin potato purple top phytoplasma TaxID=307134 RepID=A0ABT5L8X4_9MOLU|nr:hypothetical protein [Columbia Basin potato purple top phytoplasma]